MNFLYQSAFAEALGWSLIDSLWQMGAVWLFYILMSANSTRFSSEKRHSLALAGSTIGTLIFFISLGINYYNASHNTSLLSLAWVIQKQAGELTAGYAYAEQIVPVITFLYVPAVFFFSLRLIVQVSINKNLYTNNLVEANDKIAEFVNEMSSQLGIVKKVGAWLSAKAESPLTIGFWKPIVILPVAVFSHLSCKQVEAVLAHELYHIKRNDYLINIYLTVAGVVLFFNPFAQMMFANVKRERENSCDDHVIASGFDAWEYSQALYILGKHRNEQYNLAIAATGAGKEYLLHRIRRIMKGSNPTPSVFKPVVAFFLCLFVAGFVARNKHISAIPVIAVNNVVKPVVYYSEEKTITIDESEVNPVEKQVSTPRKTKAFSSKKIVIQPVAPPPATPEPPPPVELSDEEFQDLVTDYVAALHVLEFTLIDPAKPVAPDIICETPQPYVQKSSFYFTEIDTTAGKKVVEL